MSEALGFSVRIFIPSGEPEGLRIIEKSNWTGQGLAFPRALFDEVRNREEFKRTGVYILWGPSKSGLMPRAYVGEGDILLPRLNSHHGSKDFWTHAVAFTSKDQNLNKAHVQYLEARLVDLAKKAKRCELDNGNVPQPPSLSDADAADVELYLADMLLCLPVVGVSFFESPRALEKKGQGFILSAGGIEARGYEDVESFVVQSGSQVVKDEASSIPNYVSDLRTDLKAQGVLVEDDAAYRFAQDYPFGSPSTASSVVLGRSSNGRIEWRDAKGRTLKSIQEPAVDSP